MDVKEFMKQYDASIRELNGTEQENNVQMDDMDLFADVDTQNSLIIDEFEFADESWEDNDSVNSEITETAAQAEYENTNPTCKLLKSVTVEVYKEPTGNALNLRESFFQELYEDDYDVQYGDVVGTFKDAFHLDVADEYEALQQYVHIYYGIQLDKSVVRENEDWLNRNNLSSARFPYRNTDVGEIRSISKSMEEPWFDLELLQRYSLESRDTNMLIELMCQNKLDKTLLEEYSFDAEILNAFLCLVYRDRFNKALFDRILNGDKKNVTAFVNSISNEQLQKLEFIYTHKDYYRIYAELEDSCITDDVLQLLQDYKKSPYLYYVLAADKKGQTNRDFIQLYLLEESPLHTFMAEDYGKGSLNKKYLDNFKGNYYLTKAISDLQFFDIGTDLIKPLIENSDNLKVLDKYLKSIINAQVTGSIDQKDYRRYLLLLGLPQNDELIKLIMDNDKLYTFNKFWFNTLFSKLGVQGVALSDDVGDIVLVHCDDTGKKDSYFSVQDLICRVNFVLEKINALGNYTIQTELNGIIFLAEGLSFDSVQSNEWNLYSMANSSFENFLFNSEVTKSNKFQDIPDITRIIESNLVSELQKFESIPENVQKTIFNLKKYMEYDKILSYTKIKHPRFMGIIQSKYFNVCAQILGMVLPLTHNGYMDLNFLNILLKLVLKERYSSRFSAKDYNFVNLSGAVIVETTGILGFASCSLEQIVNNLDVYIAGLLKMNSVSMELTDVNKICVRGSL